MSLLDGLNNQLSNSMYDALMESEIDDEMDFEFALEAASDTKNIELSKKDIDAIMDDKNPDNFGADIDYNDEDTIDEAAIESALNELDEILAMEESSGHPEIDDYRRDPEYRRPISQEGCKSNESDYEDDDDYEDGDDFEVDDDDDDFSMESILNKLSL